MRVLFKLQHDFDVEQINVGETLIHKETEQIQQKIKANMNKSVKVIKADNIKHLAESRAKAIGLKVILKAEAYECQVKQQADIDAQTIRENASTRLEVAKNRTAALQKEVAAEVKQQANQDPVRKFNEKVKLQDSLSNIGYGGKMVVAGEQGKQLLGFYESTINEVSKR